MPAIVLVLLLAATASGAYGNFTYTGQVKVGILHSLTGSMAISEITVVNAEIMAINEINAAGGLLGKQIVPVIRDGQSNWTVFTELAEAFTTPGSPDYVDVVFGCWTSASRKAVLPVFEANRHMLFYPLQYEGQECSNNIFYMGATPNQQLEPAVDWCMRYKSTKFFLVGSDYVFPRTANQIMRNMIQATGGVVFGEEYLALGDGRNSTVGYIVQLIISQMPDGGVILNTLNGDSNVQFFHMLYDAGLRADKYPIMSFSITETEISDIGIQYVIGHYAAWNFFQSTMDAPSCPGGYDPSQSIAFVNNYRKLYGQSSLVNDPMESAYIGVNLWAQAVALAGTFDLEPVRRAVMGQAFSAPEGEVTMNVNHHLSKYVRLGQLLPSGQFSIFYTSTRPVAPQPWNTWVPSTEGHACDWTRTSLPNPGFYEMDNIRIALVHALSGSDAALEKQHLDAEMAAIKVLNRNGGVNGKNVLFTVHDSKSSESYLLSLLVTIADNSSGPAAIFGRSPSNSAYDAAMIAASPAGGAASLLFDPTRSFGGECSKSVVHIGSLLNQRLSPALQYFSQRAASAGQPKPSFFVVVPAEMPSAMLQPLQTLIKSQSSTSGQAVLSSVQQAASVASSVKAALPAGGIVLNLLENVTLSVALAQAMQNLQMTAGIYPILFTGTMESDIPQFGSLLKNHYVSQAYFASLGNPANTLFLNTMQEFYGISYVVTDQSAAAYNAVAFWADGVSKAGTFDSELVSQALWADQYSAPAGGVMLDSSNFLSQPSFIGVLNAVETGFRAITSNSTQVVAETFWLEPSQTVASQCDFAFWVRLLCDQGKGLVDAAGHVLQNRTTAVGCNWCPPGSASVVFTSPGQQPTRICRPCSAGTSQANPGQLVCEACSAGTSQASLGAASCSYCDLGQYQDEVGQSSCKSCPDPTTTIQLGALGAQYCLCPQGTYNSNNDTGLNCVSCMTGMTCPQGSVAPAQAAGYYLNRLSSGAYETYLCLPQGACPAAPAGVLGACGSSPSGERYGFVCQQCPPNTYGGNTGCDECTSGNKGTLAAAAIVSAVVLACILGASNSGPVMQSPHALTLGMVLGQLLTFLQVLEAIQTMDLDWGDPFSSVLTTFKFLALDVSVFRLSCGGLVDPIGTYAVRMVAPMIAFAYLLLLYFAARLLKFRPLSVLGINSLYCATGQLTLTLFIALSLSTLTPMQCFKNPNGTESLVMYPQLICGHSTQQSMLGIAIVGIVVYLAGTLAVVFYAVALYPSRILSDGMAWVTRYRFLFFRWRPDCHWFAAVIIVRNLCLSIWPMVIPPESRDLMQLLMIVSVELTLGATLYWRPWRTAAMNYLDFTLSLCLLLILNVGAFASMGRGLSHNASILITTAAVLSFLVILAMFGSKLYSRIRKPKPYGVFLSHHKGGGACAARLMKMVFQRLSKDAVFYDVDDLQSFEGIFDAVKQSKAVVVILSGETLCRPWCVGEVVTAMQCQIPLVPVTLSNHGVQVVDKSQSLSPEELQDVYGKFDELRPFGINVEDIFPAVQEFLKLTPVNLDFTDSFQLDSGFAKIIAQIGKVTQGTRELNMFSGSKAASVGEVLIMADPLDSEALASARVLKMAMQEMLLKEITMDVALSAADFKNMIEEKKVKCILIALTSKTLTSVPVLGRLALLAALWPEAKVSPVLIGDSFPFPDASYYSGLVSENLSCPFQTDASATIKTGLELSKALSESVAADIELDGAHVAAALQRLFKAVAKFVNVPYANETVLKLSIRQTIETIVSPAMLNIGKSKSTASSSEFPAVKLLEPLSPRRESLGSPAFGPPVNNAGREGLVSSM